MLQQVYSVQHKVVLLPFVQHRVKFAEVVLEWKIGLRPSILGCWFYSFKFELEFVECLLITPSRQDFGTGGSHRELNANFAFCDKRNFMF